MNARPQAALRHHVLAILGVLSLALLSAEVSYMVRLNHFSYSYQDELRTLHGHAGQPEFYNRLMAPALLWLLRSAFPAGIGDNSVWYLSRFLEAASSFLVLYLVVGQLTGSRVRSLAAVVLITYAYLWTALSHQTEHTSDFFDILFAALFVQLALAERPFSLAIVAAIAATNRESAAFGGVIWIGVAAARYGVGLRSWSKLAPGLVQAALPYAIVIALRYGLSGEMNTQHIGVVDFLEHWRWLLQPTGAVPAVLATLLPFWVGLARLPRPWTDEQRGLVAGALMCAAITFIFGIATELRIWLPCWTILCLVVATGEREKSDAEWLASHLR